MAEFQTVMRQAARMCKAHDECDSCPIRAEMDDLGEKCPFCGALDVAAVEQKIMGWAKEHPEPVYPTWKEWQKANFPDAHDVMHPCAFMKREEVEKVRGAECGRTSCNICARSPIPADIAEKLGIKLVGGDENG